MNIGQKINHLRKSKGYTLDKLAKLSNSSKSYIWELENKSPPRPSAQKLTDIATALNVTIDYFLDGEMNEESATDQMFYRKYQKMKPDVKEKVRKMIDLWDDD